MRMRRMLWALIGGLALLVAACAEGDGTGAGGGGPTITIGSANFTEAIVLAEIYSQALTAEGFRVEEKLNIGSREVYFPALERGEVDFLPEYTGALLRFVTKDEGSASSDSQQTYDRLAAELEERGITALEMADAEDKDAVVVTGETAEELDLEKVSDLEAVDDRLVFGSSPECPERPSCLKGLREVYGLKFKDVKTLDVAGPLTVQALEGGEVDVAVMFTTQGIIFEKGFKVLTDDMGIEVAQNIVPVVRDDVVEAHGDDFTSFVDSITAKITTEGLTRLNKLVDVDKEDPEDVAREWLTDEGFLS